MRIWIWSSGFETCRSLNTPLFIQHGLGRSVKIHDQSGLNRQTSASPNTLILLARKRHSLRCDHKTRAKRRCNMVWNSPRCARLSIQAESPFFPSDQPCSRLAGTRFSVVAASVMDWMVQPPFLLKGLKFDPDADEGFIFLHTSTSALAKQCHLLRRGG
jgi:hypothetical protein